MTESEERHFWLVYKTVATTVTIRLFVFVFVSFYYYYGE